MQFMWFKVKKRNYFPHTVHYCCSSMPRISETLLQSSSFWEARCALIVILHCDWPNTSSVWYKLSRPLSRLSAVQKNDAFVASSGDIITDYNDLYCLFTCRIASHRVNIKPCRRKPKQSTFTFTMKRSVSRTWCRRQQQYYSEIKNHAPFLCVYIWAVLCKSSHICQGLSREDSDAEWTGGI